MIRRKIRWNMTTDQGEQIRMRHTYYFAVINDFRESMRIKNRILEQMKHFDDFEILADESISGSNGLHCRIFSFTSDIPEIPNPSGIYQGDFRRDRDLYGRKSGDLSAYIRRLAQS